MQPSEESFDEQLQGIRSEIDQKKQELAPSQVEGEQVPEKSILHHVIGEKLGKPSVVNVGNGQAQVQQTRPQGEEVHSYELPELKGEVEKLIGLAFDKGVDNAVKEVKKKDDPALVDAFHDAIVDELYSRLVEEDKLKKLE